MYFEIIKYKNVFEVIVYDVTSSHAVFFFLYLNNESASSYAF